MGVTTSRVKRLISRITFRASHQKQDNNMNRKIAIAVVACAWLASASQAGAAPVTLSEKQMGNVAAGLVVPSTSWSTLTSLGATALANSSALSTPSGIAYADALVKTNLGLGTTGFSSAIKFGVR